MKTLVELTAELQALFTGPEKWTQGESARNEDQKPVTSYDDSAFCEDLKQAMKSKPLIRRAIREWARSIFVGITENGDPIPQQSQWTGTFTELGMSLHPSFRDTSVEDIYRALKDLIEEEFLELGAREGMDNVLTIKPGPKFIKAFGHLLDEPLPVRTSLFHHLKSNLDAFFEDVPGRKWIGCLNRVGYTFTYPSDAYTDGEVEDALTRLHLEGFYTVEQHGPEYHISRALSHKDKLKKAILDWHRAHFGFLKEAKDCRDTFEGFRSALGYYGAPAQYTEADFQAALYDISQDRTFDSEYLRSDTDKPWTYKVFPGPLKTPGSDEASEESLETAMLDYFKAWFTDVPKMKDWTGTIGELRERCFWVAKEGSAALVRNTKTYRIRKTLEELCFRGWLSSGADKVNKESELVYCVTPGVKMNPETTTAQIKTAILAWHKWFWDDEHCAPYANADFKRWAEILKHYGAPAGDFIGGAGYSASQFEVALRQLAEEENIPSKRCSERVTAPSEYYIFPRGTSYEKVRDTGPLTVGATIWCYKVPATGQTSCHNSGGGVAPYQWTPILSAVFPTLTECQQPTSTHTYGRGHGPKDRWEFTLDELFDMLKTLAPDAHFEGRNINQDGGKPVAQLWAWTPKGCVLLTEATP